MNKPHKHAALIKAWADGAQIQVWSDCNEGWINFDPEVTPLKPHWEYRIKPEEKPKAKYRVYLYQFWQDSDKYIAEAAMVTTEDNAQGVETHPAFVRWLTDWVEYDV